MSRKQEKSLAHRNGLWGFCFSRSNSKKGNQMLCNQMVCLLSSKSCCENFKRCFSWQFNPQPVHVCNLAACFDTSHCCLPMQHKFYFKNKMKAWPTKSTHQLYHNIQNCYKINACVLTNVSLWGFQNPPHVLSLNRDIYW